MTLYVMLILRLFLIKIKEFPISPYSYQYTSQDR